MARRWPSKPQIWVRLSALASMVDDITVDDLYDGYELTFIDGEDGIDVHCERCDKIIGELSHEDVESMHSNTLYERIIELHREAGV